MTQKFRCDVSIEAGVVEVTMLGVIDEDVDLTPIPAIGHKTWQFNLGGVKGINSCGIREWVKFLQKLPATADIRFLECAQSVVEQINMVAGFARPGTKVLSVYAPYFCESCDREEKILLQVKDITGDAAPKVPCSQCQKTMDFDAIEEQYFRFIKRS